IKRPDIRQQSCPCYYRQKALAIKGETIYGTAPAWGLSQAFAVRTATFSWLVNFGTALDGAGDSPEITTKLLKLAP
ncbi:MAG: hypothetical protein L3J57_11245, partial [Desulfuromusa sp.]|nr:hypothetical protein [Desulfuromusa sp.]